MRFISPSWTLPRVFAASLFFFGACGSSTPGSTGTGGAGTATGGASATGGAASGGASATGGAGTGGTTSTGGNGSGGAGTGGAGTGGSATGGAASGGAMQTGGTIGSGGVPSTGGAGGKVSNGGGPGGGGTTGSGGAGVGGASGAFMVTSPGWTNMAGCGPDTKTACSPLPTEITRAGAGTSPELHWTGAPAGAKSFVVVLQDLSNKTAHWILWNIPSTVTMLAANVDQKSAKPAVPAGSQQAGKGTDAATSDGYYGPGAPCNVYEVLVYALSVPTFSPTMATDQEMVRTQLNALGTSILGTASLRGRTNQNCN